MFFSFRKCFVLLPVFCLLFLFFQTVSAQEWRPVSPQELALKTPVVEPDADAEAIFWEVRVDDSTQDLILKHYVRVKIFTERGREKFSKIDVPFVKGMKVKDITARVIKPDGTTVELKKEDVFEREIAKTNDVKVKAKSFAVPNIEPGVVLEYQYKEVYPGSAEDMSFIFQRDIPIQNISYFFKPIQTLNVKYLTFNLNGNKFEKDKNGFYRVTMTNMPALRQEPQMPPEDEVRAWMLIYYSSDTNLNASDFWSRAGGYIARAYDIKDTLKPGGELKKAAADITAGAASDEEKARRIYDFCKTKIKNISFDTKLSEEEKDAIKANKATSDTYKKLQGKAGEINELFASLAVAAGLEARLAFTGDRSKLFFSVSKAHESFIHFAGIAVRVNGKWKFFDPGSQYLEYGMLPWFEEDTAALLLGSKDYLRVETPYSDIDKTVAKRTGKFKLLEDGTLEGEVRIEYTGHLAYLYKMNNYDESQNKREENLKEEIKKRMSAAEISNISIENVTDPEKPFVYAFKVRVPNYAQRTGKRLFLQPGFFEYGTNPLFSTATRKYDIFFRYPWSEQDTIDIELPKDFTLDSPDAPGGISDPKKIGSINVTIQTNKEQTALKYERQFHFGGSGLTLFQVASYEPLKGLFDAFHKVDSHTITLKQK